VGRDYEDVEAATALARTNPHLTHRGRIVIRRIGAR
jgi:hypothetical protein